MKLLALTLTLCFYGQISLGNFVESYSFPRMTSLEASLTYSFMKGSAKGKKIYIGRNIGQQLPDDYHGNNRFNYRLRKQRGQAPLVFLNVGLGGDPTVEAGQYLADLLFEQGYHVVVLRSTFTDEFAALAGSSPYVGQARIDAYDLYVMMMRIKQQLPSKGVHATDYGFMGFSFGGLVGSFVARIDDREGHFNFKKVMLINPPVDLLYGLKQLDSYYSLFDEKSFGNKSGLFFRFNNYDQILRREGFSGERHKERLAKAGLSPRDIGALVGMVFRSALKDVLLFSQLEENVGIVPLTADSNKMKRQLKDFGFEDYVTKFLPRFFNETLAGKRLWLRFYGEQNMTINFLNRQNSLVAAESTLRRNDNIVVLHNVDDFLLRDNDAAYLRRVLRDRLFLFSAGGHLGNFWHPRFRATVVEQWQLAFQ